MQPWEHRTAANGYPWLPECRRDLSADTAMVPVGREKRAVLESRMKYLRKGETVNGAYYPGLRVILIADDLAGWRYADTLHWERCRAYLHATTGDYRIADYDMRTE